VIFYAKTGIWLPQFASLG